MGFMANYLVTMWKQKHSLSFTNCCELQMAPHVAWNATREPWVHTPEYKEYLANQLKMAQIDLLSKLQMAQIDARNEELKKRFKRV
mmetsp:Transcript_13035/g.23616  ORF Transcript_13035/g.23616 Transcript_13035/m.23616 type:complete len:86 (-) Transcript_13035:124-381(-)